MDSLTFLKDSRRRLPAILLENKLFFLLLVLSVGVGFYVGLVFTVVQVVKYQLLLLAAPIVLILGLSAFHKPVFSLILALLVASMIASARLRPGGDIFRPGGAELALAPFDLLLLVITGIQVIRTLRTGKLPKLRWNFVDYALFLFLFVHLISIFFSEIRFYSVLEFLRLIKIVIFIWVLRVSIRDIEHLKLIVVILLFSVIFLGGLAFAEWTFHRTFGLGFLGERDQFWLVSLNDAVSIGRVGATLGHPNALSSFLVGLLPLAMIIFLIRPSKSMTFLSVVTIFVGAVGLVLTFSRAGWVSLSLVFGIMMLVVPSILGFTRQWLLVAVSLVFVAFSLVLIFGNAVLLRLTATSSNSQIFRIELGKIALKMLKDHPFIGVGLNTFVEVMPQYDFVGISRIIHTPAHNIFLLYAAEAGLLGLLSFLLLISSVLWLAIRSARHLKKRRTLQFHFDTDTRFLGGILLGFMSGMIAMLLQGMFDWLFRYDPIYTLFWFEVGMILILVDLIVQEHNSSSIY